MPTITKKELEDYKMICNDRDNGRILTSDGLHFICEAYQFNPEDIGKHMLEVYARQQVYRQ